MLAVRWQQHARKTIQAAVAARWTLALTPRPGATSQACRRRRRPKHLARRTRRQCVFWCLPGEFLALAGGEAFPAALLLPLPSVFLKRPFPGALALQRD